MNNDTYIAIWDLKKQISTWKGLTFLFTTLMFLCLLRPVVKKVSKIGKSSKNSHIARVSLRGMIQEGIYSWENLKKLENDEVAAVILDINSGGGEVLASERLYKFFKNLSEKKPVVALVRSLGASGAYMTALAANYIIAGNTSEVGSIGVILFSYEFTELAEKVGVKFNNLKTSILKAAPSPYEKMTPEVEETMHSTLNDVYDYFLSIFIESRKIDPLLARELADGRVYTGRQALNLGLIDEIGDEEEVLKYFGDYFEKNEKTNLDVKNMEIRDYSMYKEENGFVDRLKRHLFGYGNSSIPSAGIMAVRRF